MAISLDGAVRADGKGDGTLTYNNGRAKVFGGGGLVFMALLVFNSASTPPRSFWGVAVGVLLGLLCLASGLRLAYAHTFKINSEYLELRFAFHTRRIPVDEVETCRPRTDSRGLIYVRTYPEFVLKDGSAVGFNPIQWSPQENARAQAACEEISASLRPGA